MNRNRKAVVEVVPRLLRLRDAPYYLGVDRHRFNREVRPFVTEIRVGRQGVAFDRLELDAWAEQYKARNGRPASQIGGNLWDANVYRGSGIGTGSGTSKSRSSEQRFMRALEQAISTRRS